jgi:hypothetical protein
VELGFWSRGGSASQKVFGPFCSMKFFRQSNQDLVLNYFFLRFFFPRAVVQECVDMGTRGVLTFPLSENFLFLQQKLTFYRKKDHRIEKVFLHSHFKKTTCIYALFSPEKIPKRPSPTFSSSVHPCYNLS